MAQNVDTTNLEAQLSRLGGQVEHIAQLLQRGPAESYKKSLAEGGLDELDDFTANIKQATIQLRSFSQRWHNATIVKSEDVRRLKRREEEIEHKEELLRLKTAHMAEQEELLKAATDRMTGAAEELRKATETGSKAREALQQALVRSNATLFNDNTAKRGLVLGLSSPEKPATKRRRPQHVRGSSVGAAEVLANIEAPELLVNTIQTFGSPSQR